MPTTTTYARSLVGTIKTDMHPENPFKDNEIFACEAPTSATRHEESGPIKDVIDEILEKAEEKNIETLEESPKEDENILGEPKENTKLQAFKRAGKKKKA